MHPHTKFGIPTSKNIGDMDRTRKRDGHTDGRTVRLLHASQSSFGGIKMMSWSKVAYEALRVKKDANEIRHVLFWQGSKKSNLNYMYFYRILYEKQTQKYSKTCLLKEATQNRQSKGLKDRYRLMQVIRQVKSIAKCSLGAFCNTFDLH